jgi:hypothetical protein
MKPLVLAWIALSLSGIAFSQRRPGPYWSLGGFGNVLYPGTGHAPVTPPTGFTGLHFRQGLADTRGANNPQPSPAVIIPQSLGYDPGSLDDQSGIDPRGNADSAPFVNSNAVSPVVINQSFTPPLGDPRPANENSKNGLHPCTNASGDASGPPVGSEQHPTIYLIAFKDHTIVQALGYWIEAGMLHYVSVEYGLNQASLVRIDRNLSQRLNSERGIEFSLTK